MPPTPPLLGAGGKPLVVLAGWLGCQVKFLKRYAQLYEGMGFEVLPVVAPPTVIVAATYQGSRTTGIGGLQHPQQQAQAKGGVDDSMEALARRLLRRLEDTHHSHHHHHHHRNTETDNGLVSPPEIWFQVFSNGGAFLWEEIQRQLLQMREEERDKSVEARIRGVVFDSCPAWFGAEFSIVARAVMEHCAEEERASVQAAFGNAVLDGDDAGEESGWKDRRQKRNQEYFEFWEKGALDLPQLYLYSRDDPVCEASRVEALIRHRMLQPGLKGPILQQCWDRSIHCAHLREHPDDYERAIRDFIQIASLQSRL